MHKYNVFTHLAGFILFFTVDIIWYSCVSMTHFVNTVLKGAI